LKIIDPLTNPTAHGGNASDAFDVVIPSLPGHGFSGKPTATGWDPQRIARAWIVLMKLYVISETQRSVRCGEISITVNLGIERHEQRIEPFSQGWMREDAFL